MSSANVKVCDIGDEVKAALRKFRFKKHSNNCALILKVDREKLEICVEEELDNVELDDLQETLPSHQPRFIVYSYRMEHSDGRVSFPMCFIFFTPRDSQMELQMMYAGTKSALQREAELTRGLEVREIEDLTQEWLKERLSK